MQAICHRCGLPTVEGLCRQCTLEKTTLVSCPDQVEVVICSVCGSRQVKSRWQLPDSRSVEELAHQAAIDALCLHKELAEPQIELDLRKVGATRYLAKINIDGSFRGQSISEQCEIPVRIKLDGLRSLQPHGRQVLPVHSPATRKYRPIHDTKRD